MFKQLKCALEKKTPTKVLKLFFFHPHLIDFEYYGKTYLLCKGHSEDSDPENRNGCNKGEI